MNETIKNIIEEIENAEEKLSALDLSEPDTEAEKELRKQIRNGCRDILRSIDFRSPMLQQSSYIRQCMMDALDSYFLERNETRWGSWPINSANIESYMDSYIWPRTGCLFMERARKLVFKKKRPKDYVKRLFKGGAPEELAEILGISRGLDHKYGLGLEQRIQTRINEEAGSIAEKEA